MTIPFVPTIYEHGAALIGRLPSELAQSEDLLVEGQVAAYERYGHPLVSVGLDIYNIEAEALGGIIDYPLDASLPALRSPLIKTPGDFEAFTMDMFDAPDFTRRQLNFAAEVAFTFAQAYKELGVNIAINESGYALLKSIL